MPGRDVGIPAMERERRRHALVLAGVVAALALLTIGMALGSRIASQESAATTTTALATGERPATDRPTPVPADRTRAGAVAAAVRSITAFNGDVLLEPARLHAVVARIASLASRLSCSKRSPKPAHRRARSWEPTRSPQPVIVLRSVPVGYRVEGFSRDEATVSVWYIGIVGSGATVQPQQSWRTQVVSLVWENETWKVGTFASSPGPTPPLSTAEAAQAPGDLFDAIPRFEEFERVEP